MPRVPSDAAAHIGARIKSVRESQGISSDRLGVDAEIDPSNIRSYESGRAMPSIHSLFRIALVLNTPISEFLEGLEREQFRAHGGRKTG